MVNFEFQVDLAHSHGLESFEIEPGHEPWNALDFGNRNS